IKKVMSEPRDGPPLVLVTHGSVVTDLTGLNVRMGEFVVLGRGADGAYSVAGRLYVE
ncbi:MAG: histidine phosphatase family protein, partial [Candidatus Rokuibacteriota bacterium]